MASLVSASSVTTDRLNFFTSEQHTITITNTLGGSADGVSTMPTGFSFVSSTSGCTNPGGQTVSCTGIASSGTAEYIISSTGSGVEYDLYTLNTTVNGTSINNVSFVNIPNDEIFHTLVEYGRGRGNYFYDSMGTATSGGTGTGYQYVPNGTDFELNYLHKVYNIQQYYGLANSDATEVAFSCDYPVHTVVRQHSTDSITKGVSEWTVSYVLSRIEGSWERMGYLGMDVDDGEYNVGDNMTINCTGIDYNLADAYGHIVVDQDSFYLQIRDPEPLSIVALSNPTTIGNGTSEVAISYTVTNDEVYPLDNVIIEIDAPELAQFVGVRGELWGTAEDKYRYELTTMEPGQSETVILIARFDTTASIDTTPELSQGVKGKFVPTWELNAYNPMAFIQNLDVTSTVGVNYGVSSSINSIQTQISNIETTVNNIETTVNIINTTVNDIYDLALNINSTMATQTDVTNILQNINGSRDTILAAINASELNIIGNITAIETNINGNIISINTSINNNIDDTETVLLGNLSITEQNILNALTASEISIINQVVGNITLSEANIIANLSAQISSSLSNISVDNSEVITELDYMQGFSEELVFLVTDSVGLATDAENDFESGDYSGAIEKLNKAAEQLKTANEGMSGMKKPLEHDIKIASTTNPFVKVWYQIQGLFM